MEAETVEEMVAELGVQAVVTPAPGETESGDQDSTGPAAQALAAATTSQVHTKRQAIEWARDVARRNVDIFEGLCLRFVRMSLNVGPLYPSAIVAWREADVKHREVTRRGHAGFFSGGQYGHVVLLLDDKPKTKRREARCFSSDIVELGQVHVTTVGKIESAWGYQYLGCTDDINGETAPVTVSREPLSDRQWRLRRLRRALGHARQQGNQSTARRLRAWLDDMQSRQS